MSSTLWNPISPILSRAFSCRSFNLIRHFEPQTPKEVGPNNRNNRLPRSYELMMRTIHNRIGPTQLPRKKLYTILLSRRENKMSESVRMSTPEGRALIFKRLIDKQKRLWPHTW
ncbi:unnamed protein product [Schistosoma rodhaini]|uniref:Ribosomal protein S18 n=2 Tax=Schistosoma TaxID=6181 RepID=G4VJL1_SCHMA|nr:hypothetical protein Smp_062640 [Schistosoma mansoni]CAH8590989.1 unnamed protein product [Schistosoma rodhaini]CAH8596773.1 unnamed protein product [Schistosoma rodhaini]|eukprot:XP_018652216.1 hypothetical protein Smp_062640 [Schistosoma mansoni]